METDTAENINNIQEQDREKLFKENYKHRFQFSHITIDNSNTKVIFEFTPAEYFLFYSDSRHLGQEWSLNYRIDRSEKGKDDDIGDAIIYLSDEEAEQCKKAGFSYVIN